MHHSCPRRDPPSSDRLFRVESGDPQEVSEAVSSLPRSEVVYSSERITRLFRIRDSHRPPCIQRSREPGPRLSGSRARVPLPSGSHTASHRSLLLRFTLVATASGQR